MSIFDRFVWKNEEQNQIKRREQEVSQLAAQLQANAAEDQAASPEDAENIKAFALRLNKLLDRYLVRPDAVQGREGAALPPADGTACFYLTQDRMKAYACILPPLDGGKETDCAAFWEDLRYEGVSQGILKDQVTKAVESRRYLHIFQVARGTAPVDGVDGQISDLFERREAFHLEAAEDALVEFGGGTPIQAVRKGEIICRIQPPTQGTDGVDVTGQTLPCLAGAAIQAPAGKNTALSEDGQFLLAQIDGAVAMENSMFHVKPLMVIPVDLNGGGPLRVTGDLYIAGNVGQDAQVEATGDVIVAGAVQKAKIISTGGSVRVQRGIREGEAKAARQIQIQTIEGATIQAGGGIFAEVIANSQVTSGSAVNVLGGRGLILGGHVRAASQVSCKKIGNLSGQLNQVTVGYDPVLMEELDRTKKSLEQVKATLEKLRKSIGSLRAAGELLSLEKRAVLSQLMEQRTLYETQEAQLSARAKELRQTLHAATAGKVVCQELYPVTTVRIGDREAELKTAETNCRIHVYAGQIAVK